MLEKRERINYLYDFYGDLLTSRQQQILDLYYNQDLSLGEISAEVGITRQAAHDILKRSENTLEKLEERLGLYHRFVRQQQELKAVMELLEPGGEGSPGKAEIREAIGRIQGLLE